MHRDTSKLRSHCYNFIQKTVLKHCLRSASSEGAASLVVQNIVCRHLRSAHIYEANVLCTCFRRVRGEFCHQYWHLLVVRTWKHLPRVSSKKKKAQTGIYFLLLTVVYAFLFFRKPLCHTKVILLLRVRLGSGICYSASEGVLRLRCIRNILRRYNTAAIPKALKCIERW